MKPSSISLWSMTFLGIGMAFSGSAQAGWRERALVDGDFVIESYPPGFYPRGRMVYSPPHYWGAPVYFGRRGRMVYVGPPEVDDEDSFYEDGPVGEGDPGGEALPYAQPDAAPPVRHRDQDQAAVPRRSDGGPNVVPGLAPRRQSGPRIVAVTPPKGTPSVASVALPVPRPNLEGMDFAPAKPDAELIPQAHPADEGRR